MENKNRNILSLLLSMTIFLGMGFRSVPSFAQPQKSSQKRDQNTPTLSILDFLDQVANNHDEFKAARESAEASKLRESESHLLLSPTLFGSAQRTEDRKPSFQTPADESITNAYQLGLSQMTTSGLSGRLYYNYQDLQFKGVTLGGAAGPTDLHLVQASPVLELTLPLWRNWAGGETKSQVEQGEAVTKQALYSQTYRQKSILVQAAMAYWNLALSRETVRISQDALDRNEQLVKWQAQRARNGLGDRADLLQAQAALQNSQINLKTSQDSELSMARTFNLARGKSSTDVSEKLMPLTSEYIDRLKSPVRQELRDDVGAAREQARAATAAAELSRQRDLPTLELFGAASLNNPNPTDTGAAIPGSFKTERPTDTIGIRLSAPLDLKLISDTRAGWEREKVATELSYRRKLLEQENDWNDLGDKFRQAQERIRMYEQLEKKQKEKFDYERSRRTAGRTTTQQVLLFETDFEQAQLSRIRSLSDLFLVYAQMKLYEGAADESR